MDRVRTVAKILREYGRSKRTVNSRIRFPELDFLRFIAACGVMLFHYTFFGPQQHLCPGTGPVLSGIFRYGYLGVDLFFILSGFVILLTAYNKDAISFTFARIVRLYPAYWICVTLTAVTIVIAGTVANHVSLRQYFANLTMVHSFFGMKDVSGVYWTLAVELKFYFLVFLILAARQAHRIGSLLGIWLVASIALSLRGPGGAANFFLFPEWSSYFIAGATFFLIHRDGPSAYKLFLVAVCYLLSVAYAAHWLGPPDPALSDSVNATAVAVLIALFYLAFLAIALRRRVASSSNLFQLLGLITYPLYLIHQDIGYIVLRSAPAGLNRHLVLVLVMAAMIALACGIYLGPEKWLASHLKALLAWGRKVASIKWVSLEASKAK
jgi:peptidoglycan/LPS O-acetylase OafA/YrhL